MGLRILHSADWHLDSPFASVDENRRASLRRQMLALPGKIADIVRRENCDMVLLAGDLFDGKATAESLSEMKSALAEMRVPVFISPGNHDFCGPDSPYLTEFWPDNVHIFTGGLTYADVPELNTRVYGAGYSSMDCPALLHGFRAQRPMAYCVAVLHGDPTAIHSPCCPITAPQVRHSNLDYLALGHIHKAGSFRAGQTLCAWPGSPIGRGWDETGERYVYIADIGDRVSVRRVEPDTLRFHEMTVDISAGCESALEAVLPPAPTEDFYRVTLRGSGEPDLDAICRRFSHIPNLELRDRSELPGDLWAEAGEDSLRGTFLRLLQEDMADAGEEKTKIIDLAVRISAALLDGIEVPLP